VIRTAAIVAPSPVPLRPGGAERHWETLRASLEDAGIAADLVKLPVREHTLVDQVDGYEAFRLLDLSHVDLVITGKYPAWMVQHPNHVVWMLHPLRGLYDTFNPAAHEAERLPEIEELDLLAGVVSEGASWTDPLDVIDLVREAADRLGPSATDPFGPLVLPSRLAASVVRMLDAWALNPARVKRHFAISDIVASRPGYFPAGLHPEVIVPPSCLPQPTSTAPGAGLLSVGRLDGPKRVDLVIDAFKRVADPSATLTICGDGPQRQELEQRAASDDRIRFRGRVNDAQLAEAYADCAAVVVPPLHEDFGYVAIEAMQAGRAVITTNDSGGPAGLATDDVDALVVEPEPEALAEAMSALVADPARAAALGEAGSATAARHSWPEAIKELIAPAAPVKLPPGRRGRLVAVSTYPIADWPGGGPERARNLLGGLSDDGWDVHVVAIAPHGRGHESTVADGLSEVTVEPSARHGAAERRLRRLTANVAITDIAASVLWTSTPELVQALGSALRGADAAVAVQPYLAPAVLELAPGLPLILDDHNHERSLKAQMLPDDEAGHWMLDRVAEAEGAAATRAVLVVTTTAEDARSLEADHGLGPGRTVVVPNGVASDDVAFTDALARADNAAGLRVSLDAPESARIALFVGSAHGPNVDAAREILQIAPQFGDVVFALAGEHSDQLDSHEAPDNVRLLGAVTDERLGELLGGADVALNPMRTGGGSNLKVLTYFAAGLPVLSTPTGLRGIADPDNVAMMATVDRFAPALRTILAESHRGDTDGRVKAARELVENEFDWSVIAKNFSALVGDAIAQREGVD